MARERQQSPVASNKSVDRGLLAWRWFNLVERSDRLGNRPFFFFFRLEPDRPLDDWLGVLLSRLGVEPLSLGHKAAVKAYQSNGDLHRDPADRLLIG